MMGIQGPEGCLDVAVSDAHVPEYMVGQLDGVVPSLCHQTGKDRIHGLPALNGVASDGQLFGNHCRPLVLSGQLDGFPLQLDFLFVAGEGHFGALNDKRVVKGF